MSNSCCSEKWFDGLFASTTGMKLPEGRQLVTGTTDNEKETVVSILSVDTGVLYSKPGKVNVYPAN
jgi:hypothetical protein